MKRFIISTYALLFFISMNAAPVSREKASKMAATFLGFNESSMNMVWDKVEASKSNLSSDPAFYTFSNPKGGWVVIAGDDALSPVLAYSPDGTFNADNIPVAAKAWFKGISRNVASARNNHIVASKAIASEWTHPRSLSKGLGEGKLLQTANWGQNTPYNDLCPTISGESKASATGCVATAMAIYMRQQEWPEHGNGTLKSYTMSDGTKISGYSIDDHNYNLSDIPLTDGNLEESGWTAAQKAAVAQLMYDCGVMVEMSYSSEASAAYSSDIIPALKKHMYYSGSALEKYHKDFTNQDWFNLIKAEIDAGRVIIYGGADADTEEGHQFICDGYDANYNIHINWGWNGALNAYYSVSYIGDKRTSGINDVFNYYDSAIFGLEKDEAGTSKEAADIFLMAYDKYTGISLKSGEIRKGSTFILSAGYIANNSMTASYKGALRAVLVDKNRTLKEIICSEQPVSIEKSAQYYGVEVLDSCVCTITSDLALGDVIEFQFKNTDGTWHKLGGDQSEYDADDSNTIDRLGVYDVTLIRIPDGLEVGNTLYFDIIPGQKQIHDVAWSFDGTAKPYKYVKLTSGTHTILATVTFADGTVEKISRTITL